MSNKNALFIVSDTFLDAIPSCTDLGNLALEFAASLENKSSFTSVQILHNAKRVEIIEAIEAFCENSIANDLSLLYFAGYLTVEKDLFHFITQDTIIKSTKYTAISQDIFNDVITDFSAQSQCIIVDTVVPFEIPSFDLEAAIKASISVAQTDQDITRLTLWSGIASPTTQSWLTHYLNEGIDVQLKEPIQKLFAFESLYDYAKSCLIEHHIPQTPVLWQFQLEKAPQIVQVDDEILLPEDSRIFFSYKREDESTVRFFYDEMNSRGVQKIWMDLKSLQPGDYWSKEIDKALEVCSHMVLFVSKRMLFSTIIAHEVTTFEKSGTPENERKIIPVMLDPLEAVLQDDVCDDPTLNRGNPELIEACKTLRAVVRRVNWLTNKNYQDNPDEIILELSRQLPKITYRLPELVHVSAGTFWMGERGREIEVFIDEFWISYRPVTIGEFFHFIEANALKDTALFPDNFNHDNYSAHRTRSYWPDEDLYDYAHQNPTEPMRGITWLQAHSYVEWLNRITDEPDLFRLPTEAEWEKASRGTDKRVYPWGNNWQEGIINTLEAGYGKVLACGELGDRGNSPYGCQDMAGNIWEWTSTVPFQEDIYTLITEDMPRIIRGGAWNRDRSLARTFMSASDEMLPVYYQYDIGMRLVATRPLPAWLKSTI